MLPAALARDQPRAVAETAACFCRLPDWDITMLGDLEPQASPLNLNNGSQQICLRGCQWNVRAILRQQKTTGQPSVQAWEIYRGLFPHLWPLSASRHAGAMRWQFCATLCWARMAARLAATPAC